ncbi:Peptidase family M20/M25/M40 [Geosmithia morbida]|uniref:Peptidase family M20/M25/M40 n=1 Tax=Geosmithia morbida TaxID=1094350 RepID=A0A9P4YUP9_9HYPO|nr:Peptidase family M20/M25/M40 [Geosmithia morbida]KAF4122877.1 Peptidase family M20/M25/M40 [Geosmithia morbida]
MKCNIAMSRRSASLTSVAFKRMSIAPTRCESFRPRFYASDSNSLLAQEFTINGDRLWGDIHYTAQFSLPSPGGVTRLSATPEDKMAKDWFREQVTALGAEYQVNGTGSQFALFDWGDRSIPPIAMGSHLDSVATGGKFDGPLGVIGGLEVIRSMKEQGIKTKAPIALINWTNEEGARFFPPLGSSCVYVGRSTLEEAQASVTHDGSGVTLGAELAKIGYIGDGPNTFEEFPISAHFEIHVEQYTDLEKAGKPVGWVKGWQGMVWYFVNLRGDDGHANTYPMYGRRDALMGAAKIITELEKLAYDNGGSTTATNIRSGPLGSCNIQSDVHLAFCLMHVEHSGMKAMSSAAETKMKAIADMHGLEMRYHRDLDLPPGEFWPEAVDCVRRACGDDGIESITRTAHDSTMMTTLVPTAMVFARGKDGISHSAKEWTSKEDCAKSCEVLGKSVLNFDHYIQTK